MCSEKNPVAIELPGVAPKKRSRTENWLDQDKFLLKELVRERVRVIENKNTDTNTNKKKRDAWADLHNTFNSLCTGVQRSISQLKNQWTVMKINVKKEKAHYRREILKTGGGPYPKEPDNQDADDISSWLPSEFTIDYNEYDCDSTAVPKISVSNKKEFVTLPEGLDLIKNVEVVLAPVEVVPAPVEVVPVPVEVVPAPTEVIPTPLEVEDPLEESLSYNIADTNTIQVKKEHIKIKKQKLKKKTKLPSDTPETTAAAAAKIMEIENKCRQELHELQMGNERKRSRNLDLKYELMSAKLKYYKNKISD